eukprot:2365782-Prorocentrum_lima.AAC.1
MIKFRSHFGPSYGTSRRTLCAPDDRRRSAPGGRSALAGTQPHVHAPGGAFARPPARCSEASLTAGSWEE